MKTGPFFFRLILLSAASAWALVGCSEEIKSDSDTGRGATRLTSLASGESSPAAEKGYRTYLYSERDVDVFSRLSSGLYFERGALVEAILVEVGDAVKVGQLLATLDDDEVSLALEAAKAKAEETKARFDRIEKLRQRELVAPSEYDRALSAKRLAEAELKRAELDLSRTRVRAPFTGVVTRRYIREGELIEGNEPLFRVTAMRPLRARISVPEERASAFHSGARLHLTGVNGESAIARVLVVGPAVDPASGTREVLIELSEPNGLRPGAAVVAVPEAEEEIEPR